MNAYTAINAANAMLAEVKAEAPVFTKRPTIAAIQAKVAAYYGLPSIEMVSQRRARKFARPRQVAMYLCAELTTHSMSRIGVFFGGRDHTTVIYAVNLIAKLATNERKLEADLGELRSRLA